MGISNLMNPKKESLKNSRGKAPAIRGKVFKLGHHTPHGVGLPTARL
jgi:hypothetical protein